MSDPPEPPCQTENTSGGTGWRREDNPSGPSLRPAAELVTAWTQARSDPGFYWAAVQRVMQDVTAPDAPGDALAELIFGLSSLGGILLDQLARESGQDPSRVLTAISMAHDAV
jgi:hypothetical protein